MACNIEEHPICKLNANIHNEPMSEHFVEYAVKYDSNLFNSSYMVNDFQL